MSKPILFVDEKTKDNVRPKLDKMVEKLKDLQIDISKYIEKDISTEEVVKILNDRILQDNQKYFIEAKYHNDIEKMIEVMPRFNRDKALEGFISREDKEAVGDLLVKSNIILNEFRDIESFKQSFKHLHFKNEFKVTPQALRNLRDSVTTYCENLKQQQILEVAERVSKIIKKAVKDEVLSDVAYQNMTIDRFVDMRNGELIPSRFRGIA